MIVESRSSAEENRREFTEINFTFQIGFSVVAPIMYFEALHKT